MKILLTGSTGYVGSKLLPHLVEQGHEVVCLTRRPLVSPQPVKNRVGKIDDPVFLADAMKGIDTAYYLIHSMTEGSDFAKRDRACAENFARAAREQQIRRIIYLGGLGNEEEALSDHLRSRHEVGKILLNSGAEVIEFRAAVIIGRGSFSFELIRSLVKRLPVMVLPKWVNVLTQPIAVGDLLRYLTAALKLPLQGCQIIEIGGRDKVSYKEMMREYARINLLKRWMIPVPVLTPYLSGLWIALVTPYHFRMGLKLVESLRCQTIVRDDKARRLFPFEPQGFREAIQSACSALQ